MESVELCVLCYKKVNEIPLGLKGPCMHFSQVPNKRGVLINGEIGKTQTLINRGSK